MKYTFLPLIFRIMFMFAQDFYKFHLSNFKIINYSTIFLPWFWYDKLWLVNNYLHMNPQFFYFFNFLSIALYPVIVVVRSCENFYVPGLFAFILTLNFWFNFQSILPYSYVSNPLFRDMQPTHQPVKTNSTQPNLLG